MSDERATARHTGAFDTRAIHAGQRPDSETGAIMTPIYASSTFTQDAPGNHHGYENSRTDNPTRAALEANLASLEDGRTDGHSPAGWLQSIQS